MKISYSLKALATQVATILRASGLNVNQWNGTNVAAPDTVGYPKVTVKSGTGTGEILTSSGKVSLAATSRGTIKSIQRGSITISAVLSNTATLSPAVDTANTELRHTGQESNTNNASESLCRLFLTNTNTVTGTKGTSTNAAIVGYEVTERYS